MLKKKTLECEERKKKNMFNSLQSGSMPKYSLSCFILCINYFVHFALDMREENCLAITRFVIIHGGNLAAIRCVCVLAILGLC